MACGQNPCVCEFTEKDFNGHIPESERSSMDDLVTLIEFSERAANDGEHLDPQTIAMGLSMTLSGYVRTHGKMPMNVEVQPDGRVKITDSKLSMRDWYMLSIQSVVRVVTGLE